MEDFKVDFKNDYVTNSEKSSQVPQPLSLGANQNLRHYSSLSTNTTQKYLDNASKSSSKSYVNPTEVFRSFNTWAFKREQPSNPAGMLNTVAEATAQKRPVSFVLYWGKGHRSSIDTPDLLCLDYLDSLVSRVRQAYKPGASITLIFTDTHAELNGHAHQEVRSYFDAVRAAALLRGFKSCWLGEVTSTARALIPQVSEDDLLWEDLRQPLSLSAAKWYRGPGTIVEGARRYFLMNMIEKRALDLTFSGSIFITFNSSEFRALFPDNLPIFYMYSLRRGVAVKPWFMSADDVIGQHLPAPA